MISLICFIVFIAILVGILCYCSRKKPTRRQMAFDAIVYSDLKEKTVMRISNILNETNTVKTQGFRRQVTKLEDLTGPNPSVNSAQEDQALTAQISTPHKRSSRQRKPNSIDNSIVGNESQMQMNGEVGKEV